MYKRGKLKQRKLEDFVTPFNRGLDKNNRWVKMSDIIPWDDIEIKYAQKFKNDRRDGRSAKSAREALGALLIQQMMKLSDRETVEMIQENPYMQYFLGYEGFRHDKPFDASSMVHFRKRLSVDDIVLINDLLYRKMQKNKPNDTNDDDDRQDDNDQKMNSSSDEAHLKAETEETKPNQGKLILDATCVPSDIRYPTDLSLLNEAREKLEGMIDTLWNDLREAGRTKPRTYREEARAAYLAKAKKPGRWGIRKAIKAQLQYVRRDLKILRLLLTEAKEKGMMCLYTLKEKQTLEIIQMLYDQQEEMYNQKSHRVKDRIVSIAQHWIRPIVRGKAKSPVEFGAKLEISVVNGFTSIEKISWENFNESTGLKASVERYREKYGCYPEAVLADKLYRNRENITYCTERGIRLSGPRLGRPPKDVKKTKQYKKQEYHDMCERNEVEGKFGEAKRRLGLSLIKTKLKETSETVIGVIILTMNILKGYRRSLNFLFIFSLFRKFRRFIVFQGLFASESLGIAFIC